MNIKKILWGAIFVIAVIICVICGYNIISYFFSTGGDTSEYIQPTSDTTTQSLVETVENHNINWSKIQEDNPDLYSWIYIPNTNVD